MRSAQELERASQEARRRTDEAQRLADERDKGRDRVITRREQHAAAESRLESAHEELTTVRQSTTELASAARVADGHAEHVDTPLDGQPELAAVRHAAEQLRDRQQRAIRHVTGLITDVDNADRALADAQRKTSELDAEANDLDERKESAANTVDQRGAELVTAVRAHLDDAAELRLPDPASTIAERERHTHRQSEAAHLLATANEHADTAQSALTGGAHDAAIPDERTALDEVATALQDYRTSLAELWPAWQAVVDTERQARDTATELSQADEHLTELAERASEAEQAAASATEHHQTLRGTVGAAVEELEWQLAEVTDSLSANTHQRAEADREVESAIDARGTARGRREQLRADLAEATEQRVTATESFRRFAHTGLLAVALPELDVPDPATAWAPDPTVRLARRVNDELSDVAEDDHTWDRAQRKVTEEHKTLTETLTRQGNRATADLLDDGIVVEVEFHGRRTCVPDLVDALQAEVTDRERLLDEREREILENHLVNEVASTLQELISAAEDQVARMNEELAARPTSTGMRLRLVWRPRPDGPTGLNAARERLLRQTPDAWSEDGRVTVGSFLQERIADVRARDTAGTWLEQLTTALDYRGWHHFVIERHQNGRWKSATGPASGGERVLAASVPLFAAASSHYASAGNPHAPRLVTLDEAFAGVDDNARAKYLGLLAAFDLDVVMTSEREWGCYPEVPGLAIAQLSRTEGVDAVLVTHWTWNGSERVRLERPSRPTPESQQNPTEQQGLWA